MVMDVAESENTVLERYNFYFNKVAFFFQPQKFYFIHSKVVVGKKQDKRWMGQIGLHTNY